MTGAERYVYVLCAVLFCSIVLLPQPYGQVFVMALFGLQALAGAAIFWRRPGMRVAAASHLISATGFAVWITVVLRGGENAPFSPLWWAAFALVLAGGALFGVERRVTPETWKLWYDAAGRASLKDILLMRTIPRTR